MKQLIKIVVDTNNWISLLFGGITRGYMKEVLTNDNILMRIKG